MIITFETKQFSAFNKRNKLSLKAYKSVPKKSIKYKISGNRS